MPENNVGGGGKGGGESGLEEKSSGGESPPSGGASDTVRLEAGSVCDHPSVTFTKQHLGRCAQADHRQVQGGVGQGGNGIRGRGGGLLCRGGLGGANVLLTFC